MIIPVKARPLTVPRIPIMIYSWKIAEMKNETKRAA
jgi:hypothetical protein